MTGERPTSVTDSLKEEKRRAEEALAEATRMFEEEKRNLLSKLEESSSSSSGTPIILTMPVTKQEVTFELKRVDPSLIDVSTENERIQEFLDEISLQDILPSIRKHGQQKPGTIRPKPDGRYELIEGSRRLAAVKIAGSPYLALVGAVPDADVRELGVIENRHQDVSPYEKAKSFERHINSGEFENWTQLGAAKGISSSHISRFRACVQLPEIFVRILPSPSDMPLSYGETISSLLKKDADSLSAKAEELLNLRQEALKTKSELPDAEMIIKLLKSAVRSKTPKPTAKKPIIYKSKDGKVCIKHSLQRNNGSNKFELSGVDDEKLEKIKGFILSTLGIEPK
jgi:ParB family chromosome partitioning protein